MSTDKPIIYESRLRITITKDRVEIQCLNCAVILYRIDQSVLDKCGKTWEQVLAACILGHQHERSG